MYAAGICVFLLYVRLFMFITYVRANGCTFLHVGRYDCFDEEFLRTIIYVTLHVCLIAGLVGYAEPSRADLFWLVLDWHFQPRNARRDSPPPSRGRANRFLQLPIWYSVPPPLHRAL